MHEGIEHKTIPPTEAIATEHLEEEASPEEEITEADLMLGRAKTEVEEFSASGLPHAEKIATEMGTEVDEETKVALTELNKEAEFARQMLGDTLIGRLRLKSADYLKKYLPKSSLTEFAGRKNTEIISKKTTEKLEEFLKKNEDYHNPDYPDADQAVEYFEAHKNSLTDEDRKNLESRVQEAVKVHNERKAEALSKKTVEDLQEFLKYDHDKRDYKQAIEAVSFFIENKNSLKGYERQNQERKVFDAVENHLKKIAGDYYSDEGSWQDALNKYKEIPNDFFADKNIQSIGYQIYAKAQTQGLKPEELIAAFEGNLDLLSSGSRYQNNYDNFSSEQRVKIVEETYKKLGPSRYISQYRASDFEGKDREQILKPLFESYKVNNQREILSQINEMKGLYDQLPQEERNDLIKNLISDRANEVADKFDSLNLNEEHKKLLVERLIQNKDYKYLQSEAGLEKLGANKEEVFNELLKNDAANLFAHREVFNPSPEQYKLLLDRVTGDLKVLEKALGEIYHSYSGDTKKLTEEELQAFQSVVEKNAPHLIFRFKNVFEDTYKEKLDLFFKELPKGLSEDELERFVRHVVEDLGGWEKNVERVRALVVEAGEQKVTNEYLEQLDNIGLKLPNRVMGKIKENVKKAEQRSLLDYFRSALEKNTTLEQIQREVQQRLEQVTTQADYFKAVHLDVLKNVLKDRRFKTQFETHSSNGTLNPHYRAQQEAKMFNYASDEEKGKRVRPNYGYMSDNEHGIVGSFSESHVSSNVGNYGRIHVKFKKEQVTNRTTITFNDSLGRADEIPPTPSTKPHFTGLEQRYNAGKIEHASKPGDWGSSYLEVQYHWPLRTSLIESIHISEKNSLSKEEMREVEEMVRDYNEQNPNDKIKVIAY